MTAPGGVNWQFLIAQTVVIVASLSAALYGVINWQIASVKEQQAAATSSAQTYQQLAYENLRDVIVHEFGQVERRQDRIAESVTQLEMRMTEQERLTAASAERGDALELRLNTISDRLFNETRDDEQE